jgi:hypothetical protein
LEIAAAAAVTRGPAAERERREVVRGGMADRKGREGNGQRRAG